MAPLILSRFLEILPFRVFTRILEKDLVERVIIFPRQYTIVRDRIEDFAKCIAVVLCTSVPQIEEPVRQRIHHYLILTGAIVVDVGDPNGFEILIWSLHVLRYNQAQVLPEKLSSKGSCKSRCSVGLSVHVRVNGDRILDDTGNLRVMIAKLGAVVQVGRPAYDDTVVSNQYLSQLAPPHG